jgi:SNF2 family DNA or RNA helicase
MHLEKNYELRPFQRELLEKYKNYKRYPHALIGDEMGLGKTVEAIALDRMRRMQLGKPKAKSLIIAPLSVVDVWKRHYGWMLPNMRVTAYDSQGKQPAQARAAFLDDIANAVSDIYIVHWDALRLMPELAKRQWFSVIADEAHRAKNRKAQQTRALKKLPAVFKVACTGTPAETRPDDLWSILNWLYPKEFSSYWRFYKSYVLRDTTPQGYKVVTGVRNVDILQKEIKPFYIRRLKQDVLKDLPDKQYTTINVQLPPQQRKMYEQMKKDMLAWVGEHESEPLAAPAVIAKLMRLQQFAISSIDVVPGFKMVGDEKIPTRIVKMVDPSAKLDAVMQIIEDNPDESFVVFSQFKQVINLLGRRLDTKKIRVGLYTGDTDKSDRDRIVQQFQEGELRVFAGTIRAGGEGITLTKASTVIFIDRDWSPSKNRQAEDRVHRVGQKNAVQIIDIVATNTVDAGRHQKINQSWKWIKQFIGDGGQVAEAA